MSDANPSPEKENPTGSEASETLEKDPPTEVTDEMIKDHPLYKKLDEERSAADKDKERYKGRLTKAQQELDPKKEEPEEKKEESEFMTKDEYWEKENKSDIDLYSDEEYEQDVADGIPKEKALKYAKIRLEANPDKAHLERKKQSAQGSNASERNLESDDITERDRENMKTWDYTEEALLKQKALKKERGN